MTPAAERKRLAYFAWAAVCLIWGTTYLGIRVSLESVPPALMGGIRCVRERNALALCDFPQLVIILAVIVRHLLPELFHLIA